MNNADEHTVLKTDPRDQSSRGQSGFSSSTPSQQPGLFSKFWQSISKRASGISSANSGYNPVNK